MLASLGDRWRLWTMVCATTFSGEWAVRWSAAAPLQQLKALEECACQLLLVMVGASGLQIRSGMRSLFRESDPRIDQPLGAPLRQRKVCVQNGLAEMGFAFRA